MPIQTVRIEEHLWSTGSLLRKQDWRTSIHDIVSGVSPWPSREPCTLIAGCDDNNFHFTFTGTSHADEHLTVPRSTIAPIIKEYTDLIKKLSGSDHHDTHFEVLDMAKRVVHDSGARKLAVLLPGVGANFETNRRLFTLIVSLTIDTTRLGPYPAHRHHATPAR
jgi:hypothetical protein